MKIIVTNLKPGDRFKYSPTQRKWRVLNKLVVLGNGSNIPEAYRGMMLLIFDGCKQLTLAPDTTVIIPQ